MARLCHRSSMHSTNWFQAWASCCFSIRLMARLQMSIRRAVSLLTTARSLNNSSLSALSCSDEGSFCLLLGEASALVSFQLMLGKDSHPSGFVASAFESTPSSLRIISFPSAAVVKP